MDRPEVGAAHAEGSDYQVALLQAPFTVNRRLTATSAWWVALWSAGDHGALFSGSSRGQSSARRTPAEAPWSTIGILYLVQGINISQLRLYSFWANSLCQQQGWSCTCPGMFSQQPTVSAAQKLQLVRKKVGAMEPAMSSRLTASKIFDLCCKK